MRTLAAPAPNFAEAPSRTPAQDAFFCGAPMRVGYTSYPGQCGGEIRKSLNRQAIEYIFPHFFGLAEFHPKTCACLPMDAGLGEPRPLRRAICYNGPTPVGQERPEIFVAIWDVGWPTARKLGAHFSASRIWRGFVASLTPAYSTCESAAR